MKVLYLSYAEYPDYQADSLFLGLRELLGENVVDYPKIKVLYKNTFAGNPDSKKDIGWGMGFTLYGLLDDIEVDRSDIQEKIKNRFFDLVIYGGSYRATPLLLHVLRWYPKEQIVFIDGDDSSKVQKELVFRGIYFKREMHESIPNVYPISFAIPPSCIVDDVPMQKERLFSICDPRDRKTYIYDNQEDYYHGYQEAFFGVTMKKAGWDALRHYEILANGCIPFFIDLQSCPLHTCWNLPKYELTAIKQMALQSKTKRKPPNVQQYVTICSHLLEYTRNHLTTTVLGKHVLDTVKRVTR
ncbi:MAG: hypothetical protein VX278_06275 [Myxococcota bacterium]|nr:hypothetical protein [Myxococcota bacterium]